MPYIVYIKQLGSGATRIRQEQGNWSLDSRLWTRGSRACDCARALLFALDREAAACPCGVSSYAIRVMTNDGGELYCEEGFEEEAPSCPLPQEASEPNLTQVIARQAISARLSDFTRKAFEQLSAWS